MYKIFSHFSKIVAEDNALLNPIISSLSNVKTYNSQVNITNLKLASVLPAQFPSYYRYPGSLTTPECAEVVEWFVVEYPVIPISDSQLIEFQALKDEKNNEILTNSRNIQSLRARTVQRSFSALSSVRPDRFFASASGFGPNN